jgi:hypothetical protein
MMKLDAGAMEYLRGLTEATVDASRVKPGDRAGGSPPNKSGKTLIRPGGREAYPAYWVRDFAMSMAAGFMSEEEVRHALDVTARTQNGDRERRLRNGAAVIPPWAVVDHMNFDGGAVFYPGAYSAGEDQGGEPFGVLPPSCDHYYFVEIAHHLWTSTRSAEFLKQGEPAPMIDRLHRAFAVPDVDGETGAVTTTAARRAVGFGFFDCVYLVGSLLFPTLLRYRAASQMAALCGALNDESRAADYYAIAKRVKENLPGVFVDEKEAGGWLIASTETGRQPDVWGTLYALYLNVLPDDVAKRARETIVAAIRKGSILHKAAVRHLPIEYDHSPETAWQQAVPGVARGTYQNGAYWHTPAGWLIAALSRSHPEVAGKVFEEYIAALKEDDFRKGPAHGAPWECFGKDNGHRQNPVYMTSVTVPYAVLRETNE